MNIQIDKLNTDWKIRAIKDSGVEALKNKLNNGFLDSFPITVDENLNVLDGHHRVEASKQLGIKEVPYIIKDGLTDSEKTHFAFMANEASETSVPMTMVDYCEFIWKSEDKLADIAVQLGWSLGKVKDHSALKVLNYNNDKKIKVDQNAWTVIVDFFNVSTEEVDLSTFNRKLIASLIGLSDMQQLELVTDLADNTINKNKFKALAEKYKAQNEDIETLTKELENSVSKELLEEAILEVETGNYDLTKLIQLAIDKHDKVNSIKLIHGDFYEEVKNVPKDSVDLIVTDPPYNIAHERIVNYDKNGRSGAISKDFGEWDKIGHNEFIDTFKQWAEEFYRILKTNKACYIWTSDIYLSHISEAFKEAGFKHRSTLVWHKTNPGTSQMKDNFISSNEYCIYFIKDKYNKENTTFNWFGDADMLNFMQSGICGGNERIKDSKGNTLHPTQKPEKIIKHIVDISSNKGDTVFDGFMGTGTTASICKKEDRRFVGIEFDSMYFEASKKRTL